MTTHIPQPTQYSDAPQQSYAPRPGGQTDPIGPVVPVERQLPAEYGLQAHGSRWWKGVLSILALAAVNLVANLVLMVPASFIGTMLGFTTMINPATIAALNLSWAVMIPVAPAVMRWIHKVPKGAMSSVEGGFRWGRMWRALAWVLPLYLVSNIAGFLAFPEMAGPAGGALTPTLLAFGIVCLFTTPFQAAGEEYMFRGAITASAATWAADPRTALAVGTAVSSLVFGLAHGATDPWLFVYYCVFGLAMNVVSRLTRGLELAVLVHAVNNVLSLWAGVLMGMDLEKAFDRSAGAGGPFMLVPMAVLAIVCLVTWALKRRRAGRMSA
ncbi:CPBP family intramembrane metalloprotease [Mariniluteicoccus endophyticus]